MALLEKGKEIFEMKVTLKDGSVREYAQPMAVIDIAKDISEGLARNVCAATVNGEGVDIKRRTVAKYREALGIGRQSQRRR